ncbi:MAG: prepilin-type N-terminal cleavage/methylation domain-containing protein [Candidatus Buchananbacteria bacterium]
MFRIKERGGFTLIELMVVIAIIGFISMMTLAAVNNSRIKAVDTKRISEIKAIQTALELYFNDQKVYPGGSWNKTELGEASDRKCLNADGWTTAGCSKPYMGSVPKDPKRNDSNLRYMYRPSLNRNNYFLRFYLEKGVSQYNQGFNFIQPNGAITTQVPF